MSLAISEPAHTVEQYLEIEREAEERCFYLDGVIYEMAGESPEHGLISTNLTGEMVLQLRGTPCALFSKGMKVSQRPRPISFTQQEGIIFQARHRSHLW